MRSRTVTRRSFLLGATAIAAAACTRTSYVARHPTSVVPRPAIPSGLEPVAGDTLRVLTWDLFLWKGALDEFSRTYRVDFEIATMNNVEEGMQRIADGFDVYIADVSDISTLVARGDLQPLNTSYLGHLGNLWPEARTTLGSYGPYGVPYGITPYGVAWLPSRVDDLSLRLDPYGAFWDPAFARLTSFPSDPRAVLGVALLRIGADPNTEDPEVLARAADELKASNAGLDRQRAALTLVPSTRAPAVGAFFRNGSMYAPITHSRFAFPSSGALVLADAFVVPRKAHDPVLGHLFLDFMLRPKIALANAEWVGITPPVGDSEPRDRLASGLMTREEFAAAHPIRALSPGGQAAWTDAWDDVRATLEARA